MQIGTGNGSMSIIHSCNAVQYFCGATLLMNSYFSFNSDQIEIGKRFDLFIQSINRSQDRLSKKRVYQMDVRKNGLILNNENFSL